MTCRAAKKPVPASPAALTARRTALLVGKESVGKSAVVRGVAGGGATSRNFRGTTVVCETYDTEAWSLVDAPGILRASDSETTRLTIQALNRSDVVLLVLQATHLDEDLEELLPLVHGHPTAIAVTFWDRVRDDAPAREVLTRLAVELGAPVVPFDAREIDRETRAVVLAALEDAAVIECSRPPLRAGWRIAPRRTVIERPVVGQLLAVLLLFAPALVAVLAANAVAGWLEPAVERALAPIVQQVAMWPGPLGAVLAGDYGFLTMGPLLLVWALPTVVVYALVIAAYKASGLIDRVGAALHPLLRPVGLHGRDVTRVLMGFGCNVPAIISTRSCASCTRATAVGTIAFGSACSYQLGATLAVFAAAGRTMLVIPYLLVLIVATLVYARLTSPAVARSPLNALVVEQRTFLTWPRWRAIRDEAATTIRDFLRQALPIFFVITAVASVVAWAGLLDAIARGAGPPLAIFALPAEAALPVVLASVRKDGILLLAEGGTVEAMTAAQTLAAVFLAGTLLPCLVTALTVTRELGARFAGAMLLRQATAAVAVTLVIAWVTVAVAKLI